jgi:hypothetical protein
VEKLVRERFGKALTRGIGELKVKRATHSPISGLIDNAVIEVNYSLSHQCLIDNTVIEVNSTISHKWPHINY